MIRFRDLKEGDLVVLERTEVEGFFAAMKAGDLTIGEFLGKDEDGDFTFLIVGPDNKTFNQKQCDADYLPLVRVLEIL